MLAGRILCWEGRKFDFLPWFFTPSHHPQFYDHNVIYSHTREKIFDYNCMIIIL